MIARVRSPARVAQLRHIQDLLGRAHDLHVLTERVRQVQIGVVRTSRRTTAAELGRLARTLDDACRAEHAAFMSRRPASLTLCGVARRRRLVAVPVAQRPSPEPAVPTSLELYLVRHAVAARARPGLSRRRPAAADARGRGGWRRSVAGLRELGVVLDVVLASPLVRAHETAEILAAGLKPKPKLVTSDALSPGRKVSEVLAVIAKIAAAPRGASRIALVGHEPDLGELAARLLGAKGPSSSRRARSAASTSTARCRAGPARCAGCSRRGCCGACAP